MPNIRMSRIDSEIQKAVAKIIDNKLEHPIIKSAMVSVLHVETTPDLLFCKISVSVYGTDAKTVIDALNSSKNFIRHELGKAVRLRTTPDIKFVEDTTLAYAQHMDKLFDSIK